MSEQDIRWVQRLNSYRDALARLEEGVELASERNLSDLEKEGVIQRFEFTHELAGNVVKDFYQSLGHEGIHGSRDAFMLAFQNGLITKGEELLESINSRNKSSHAYSEEEAAKIFRDIINKYYEAFEELKKALCTEKEKRNL